MEVGDSRDNFNRIFDDLRLDSCDNDKKVFEIRKGH